MKTINAEIHLYKYEELTEESKQKAFFKHKDFLDSMPTEYEIEEGILKNDFIEHSDDDVLESLEINDYWFFANGELADCVTYTGKHEKTGTTEFKFFGKVYKI